MNSDQARYLAKEFVEGKIQSHFLVMALTLQNFITKLGPHIEAIEASITTFGKKRLMDVFGQDIAKEITEDLRTAEQALNEYKVTRSLFENRLYLVSSNIGLQNFLKDNSVSLAQAGSIARNDSLQAEIEQYWQQTYGPLWSFFDQIKNKLYVLETILVVEVKRLRDLSQSSFASEENNGFDIQKELQGELFQRERQAFWELNKFTRSNTKLLRQANSLYSKQKSQTRVVLEAYINLAKKASLGSTAPLKEELAKAEGALQKSIILLLFTVGIFITFNAIAAIFVEKSTGISLEVIIKKIQGKAKLGVVQQKAINALSSLVGDSITPLAGLLKAL